MSTPTDFELNATVYNIEVELDGTTYNLEATWGAGPQGVPGTPGLGVPAGGSTGQMLTKKSGSDNDTEWKTPLKTGTASTDAMPGNKTAGDLGGALKTKGGAEAVQVASSATGTVTLDLASASILHLTIGNGAVTIVVSNPPASGISCTATFLVKQYSTAKSITWPVGWKWYSNIPDPDDDETCMVNAITVDGGTTWHASGAVEQS